MKVKDALEILLQVDPELEMVMADLEPLKVIEYYEYTDKEAFIVVSDMDGTEDDEDEC